MKDLVIVAGVFLVWFVLNRWVLPSMGVST